MTLAVTGGTGFVGSRLIDLALAGGHRIRALTRRPQAPREGIDWIEGALDNAESLRVLSTGADAVIHIAGVINAPDRAGFEAGNVIGTGMVLAAAREAGVGRFAHVSSLSAREPQLSRYGGSKAQSEALVTASPLPSAIVRPPAVYGPGDRETLELFKMAKRGVILMPPEGRLSLIHVDDLARLLLSLARPDAPSGLTVEPDDERPGGWSHREFGEALGDSVGRKPLILSAPRPLLQWAAKADTILRGSRAKLTPDRASYFSHPDWVVDPARRPDASLWRPAIDTRQGLADTARWYRDKGWL